jgi:hypothetical protein
VPIRMAILAFLLGRIDLNAAPRVAEERFHIPRMGENPCVNPTCISRTETRHVKPLFRLASRFPVRAYCGFCSQELAAPIVGSSSSGHFVARDSAEARKIRPDHLVLFHSEAHALAQGFTPPELGSAALRASPCVRLRTVAARPRALRTLSRGCRGSDGRVNFGLKCFSDKNLWRSFVIAAPPPRGTARPLTRARRRFRTFLGPAAASATRPQSHRRLAPRTPLAGRECAARPDSVCPGSAEDGPLGSPTPKGVAREGEPSKKRGSEEATEPRLSLSSAPHRPALPAPAARAKTRPRTLLAPTPATPSLHLR